MRRSSVSNAMSSMTHTQAASTVSRSICASLAPVLHIAPNRALKKSWVLMAGLAASWRGARNMSPSPVANQAGLTFISSTRVRISSGLSLAIRPVVTNLILCRGTPSASANCRCDRPRAFMRRRIGKAIVR